MAKPKAQASGGKGEPSLAEIEKMVKKYEAETGAQRHQTLLSNYLLWLKEQQEKKP